MRNIAAAALFFALGCAKTPDFTTYQDAQGEFSLDVPADWVAEAAPRRKPAFVTSFLMDKTVYQEGQPIGPVLHVSKFYRDRGAHPGSDEDFLNYKEEVLNPSDVLFGASTEILPEGRRGDFNKNVLDSTLSGLPAKTYRESFPMGGGPLHGDDGTVAVLEDIVLQTPEAYYVLEYRATEELFDRYYYAFTKAAQTFRLKS